MRKRIINKILLFLILMLLCAQVVNAMNFSEVYQLVWAKNTGGEKPDEYHSVIETNDGYIAVGVSYGTSNLWGNNGDRDGVIVKYNLDGTIAWARNEGGSECDFYNSVVAANDGYIVVGGSYSTNAPWGNDGNFDAIIIKYNLDGTVAWAKNTGGSDEEIYESVAITGDGYIAVGYSLSSDGPWGANNGELDAIITKYNLDGTIAWAKSVGGSTWDWYKSVSATNDGYIAVRLFGQY